MHIFTVLGSKDTHLLCFSLFLLQWNNSKLPNVCLWLSKQWNGIWELHKVSSFIYLSFHNLPLFFSLSSWDAPQHISPCILAGFLKLLLIFSLSSCHNSPKTPHLASVVNTPGKPNRPMVQCTSHMCPIRVHWHVKLNYKEYWRVKITITNFNYAMNYSLWNLVVQHPNFDNLTQLFSFYYKSLTPYEGLSKLTPAKD